MSNNIYDILKKIENLEGSRQTLTEGKKAKPDYIDIDRDGDKKEPMKKAAKDKAKGGMAEAVARVEQQLSEKYMGFKKTVAAIEKGGSAENPEAVAASIGRKKYGKEKFQKAAAAGKKLGEDIAGDDDPILRPIKKAGEKIDYAMRNYVGPALEPGRRAFELGIEELVKKIPGGKEEIERKYKDPKNKYDGGWAAYKDEEVKESGLQAYLGKKKYGEEGMKALQQAGREGASKEKMAKIRARHDKMDEDAYNEDMLSPKQKEIARKAGDPDKIDADDFAALRGEKKGKKDEGNEFSGELVKARAQGKDSFEVDGKSYPVKEARTSMREGWEEMQKYLEKKRGPESKGGEGKKAGTRYGGSAQRDDDEEMDGEGQPTVKKKGRPKGTGGGAKFSFKKPKD